MRFIICDLCGEGISVDRLFKINLTPLDNTQEKQLECCENCWNGVTAHVNNRIAYGKAQRDRVEATALNLKNRGTDFGV